MKKPKDFGFFDYSTPVLRRHFCQQEVLLNVRLAPQVYLGVAPVLLFDDGRLRFGPPVPPGEVPLPGTIFDGGRIVDYAVVMVRLPDGATLERRVRAGTASPSLLQDIARFVAAFHATSQMDEHIASFGRLEVIGGNWEENFAQMQPYIGRTLDTPTYNRIVVYIRRFMEERAPLFASRVEDGRIRDCHGDLRLQHVYLLDGEHELAIIDGIEFNERFRYSDVASEVAFLSMELEAAGRFDLSRAFVDGYVAATGDDTLRAVLPFYTCYRACVRGKVASFQLDEAEVPAAHLVAALAAPAQGALHLMQVVKVFPTTAEEGFVGQLNQDSLKRAETYLAAVKEQAQESFEDLKLSISWSVALDADVADAITGTAEYGKKVKGAEGLGNSDLIAMATHGRGGLEHWMIGSVTERVLSATRLPLLIVRPQNKA